MSRSPVSSTHLDKKAHTEPNNVVFLEDTSVEENGPEFDPIKEEKLLHKVDRNLIPILFLLFLCAFIDRINIGNARIQGLEKSLDMHGSDYNIALFVFFIPYIMFEIPCNILLKKVRPSVFIPTIMALWGFVTIAQGFTGSFHGLVVCRIIIGALEAGFFPGCIYLISMFYKRGELQWRINLFFSASILAGAFSGLLAYAIAHMDGYSGYEGWRWIFILEGAATVVVAVVAWRIMPDWPENAKFLNDDERKILLHRLALDQEDANMDTWNKATAKRVFGDVKIWLGSAMYLGIVTTSYSGALFTPTILKQLGWTSIRAQIMSIPVFVTATVLTLTCAWLSDRLRMRLPFILLGCSLATIGYILMLSMRHIPVGGRYFAVYLIIAGGYIAQPITLGWLNNNLGGHYKRGIGAAIQVSIGNIGGIIASNIFIAKQAPTYHLGFGLDLGLVWLCVASAFVFFVVIKRENRLRDEGKRNYRLDVPEGERKNLGDDHPSFRFIY